MQQGRCRGTCHSCCYRRGLCWPPAFSVRPCGVSSPLHTSPRSCCAYSGYMLLKIMAFLQKKRMRASCNSLSLYIDRHVPSFIYLLINLNIRHIVYGAGTPPDGIDRPTQKQAGKEFMLKTQWKIFRREAPLTVFPLFFSLFISNWLELRSQRSCFVPLAKVELLFRKYCLFSPKVLFWLWFLLNVILLLKATSRWSELNVYYYMAYTYTYFPCQILT